MYEETSIDPTKYVVIGLLILGILLSLFLVPLAIGKAQTSTSGGASPALFSDTIAANTLCSAGLSGDGCGTTGGTTSQPQSSGLLGGLFGGSSGPQFDPVITVVNVPGQDSVYRIVNGQKHAIPTTEIFYSYGFKLNIVQEIAQRELDKYPDARLFMVEGSEDLTIYYLTDSGMVRPILNDKVFYSYGDRKEDVITINQKEFNYYPRNQYVYIERPKINRDVYQITGGVKRYLTPVAVKRLDLKEIEIAPINQIEFDEYPEGEPVIF
jgi:hypothetical protein